LNDNRVWFVGLNENNATFPFRLIFLIVIFSKEIIISDS
jgi:hypothetical protein